MVEFSFKYVIWGTNIGVGLFVMVCGILHFLTANFASILSGIYTLCFGVLILMMELKSPNILRVCFGFFQYWAGRGLFYIYLGIGCFFWNWMMIFGATVVAIGILYILIQFLTSWDIPPPIFVIIYPIISFNKIGL